MTTSTYVKELIEIGIIYQEQDLSDKRKKNIFDSIWILFPDPWPKKRHSKRRLINNDFMKRLISIIKRNGKIHIVTDSQSYLRQILSSVYKFRNYFFTGVVVLIPIGITLYFTLFLINISSKFLPKELNPNHYLPYDIPGVEIIISIVLILGIIKF